MNKEKTLAFSFNWLKCWLSPFSNTIDKLCNHFLAPVLSLLLWLPSIKPTGLSGAHNSVPSAQPWLVVGMFSPAPGVPHVFTFLNRKDPSAPFCFFFYKACFQLPPLPTYSFNLILLRFAYFHKCNTIKLQWKLYYFPRSDNASDFTQSFRKGSAWKVSRCALSPLCICLGIPCPPTVYRRWLILKVR